MSAEPSSQSCSVNISARTVLVGVQAMRAIRGLDSEAISKAVDNELIYVWNVASNPKGAIRDLRFWIAEARDPAFTSKLSPAKVVERILGARARFRSSEVSKMLLVSRPTIFKLVHHGDLDGDLVGGCQWITRASLERFLKLRWCGAALPGQSNGGKRR